MLGMSQSQLQHEIEAQVRGAMIAYPEYQNLQQIIDRIIEGVAMVIAKNNAQIEQQLRNAGIKI